MSIRSAAENILPAGQRFAERLRAGDETAHAQKMALTAFTIRIVSAGIAFVSQIVQARLMGEFEYGIFVFIWILVILFGNFSCLGFHSAIIRFLPQYHLEDARSEIRGLTFTARVFAMFSATALAAAGFAALFLLQDKVNPIYVVPAFFGLVTLPMIALGDVLDGTARANSWAISAFSQTYILRPSLILLFMVAAVFWGRPATATTAMQAALAATYLTTLVQFVSISWRMRKRYLHGPRTIDFMAWFRVALPIFLIEGFGFLLTNADVVIVGFYLPPDRVAVYFAAAKTMALVQFVYFSVKAAAGPRFSVLIARQDTPALAVFAAKAARWTFWPSLAVGLGVLAAGKLLLGLFGPAFTEGYPLMAILFLGTMMKALVGPGEILLSMAGRQKLCAALYAGILSVNIALNVLLIPLFGLTGAALATATATGVEALLLHIAVRRTLGIALFAFASRQTPTVSAEVASS
ncbi:lipopolysaccharide biosynthesis protein [Rhizobiaceae bacterium BDR2-2]|uniref:Lipopolysaccharide biosynthesis protein n=1 Tax=Ectorhizobium quercum TaxID=2965071 RepID=A0AAE3SX03_9HYPH|nr:lipopolysaccharide biosynthesis protein [Ectorhizobium quercum]MCX8999965.1 lipopolysaccharide biosynthesis protein [Ectorhizobium quercum]